MRAWHNPRPKNSGRVKFEEGRFKNPPTVLAALNMFEMAGNADLRVKVYVDKVDTTGFSEYQLYLHLSDMDRAAADYVKCGIWTHGTTRHYTLPRQAGSPLGSREVSKSLIDPRKRQSPTTGCDFVRIGGGM